MKTWYNVVNHNGKFEVIKTSDSIELDIDKYCHGEVTGVEWEDNIFFVMDDGVVTFIRVFDSITATDIVDWIKMVRKVMEKNWIPNPNEQYTRLTWQRYKEYKKEVESIKTK